MNERKKAWGLSGNVLNPAERELCRVADKFPEVGFLLDDLGDALNGGNGSAVDWQRGRVSGYLFALLVGGKLSQTGWGLACDAVRKMGRAQP